MSSDVALTALTVALSVATLLSCLVLAVIFHILRRKRQNKLTVTKPLLRTTPIPMSSGLFKLRTDYGERFYSDSEDSGAVINRWNGHHTDDSIADDLSDCEYTGRRSSSIQSVSSSDNWLLSSYEDAANEIRTPGSSASNSPNIGPRLCFLNLSVKYNFHQESLDVVIINITGPPKQKSGSKGLFIIAQLFVTNENGEDEDFNTMNKTEVKNYSSNMLFNEEFKFEALQSYQLQAISIRLSLCSHDRFSRVQSLGEFIVNLNEVTFDPAQPLVLQRRLSQINSQVTTEEKDKGELSLSLRYQRGSKKISVIVLKATNLKKPKKFMTNDPYITIKLLYNDELVVKKKTKSKKGSSSPCWNEPFAFDLDQNDLTKYMLIFTMKCKDIFSSVTKLGVVRIGAMAESTGKDHWNDSVCSKNNTMRQVTMTHKLS